jgi:hypothetical protein
VQCLYCETELKPFRGLFDEDFCCREHRDKYFSSFRKAVRRLPDILGFPETPVPDAAGAAPDEIPAYPAGIGEPGIAPVTAEILLSDAPLMADFLPVTLTASCGAGLLPAVVSGGLHRGGLQIPGVETDTHAEMPVADESITALDPADTGSTLIMIGNVFVGKSAANTPLTSVRLPLPSLESADPTTLEQGRAAANYAPLTKACAPIDVPRPSLTLPAFHPVPTETPALPEAAETELNLHCRQLVSTPFGAPQFQLAHAVAVPSLAASSESMSTELEAEDFVEQAPDASVMAPPALLHSTPLDRPVPLSLLSPAVSMDPVMQLNLPSGADSSSTAPLNLVARASTLEPAVPAGASEMTQVPASLSEARNSAAEPHSGEHVRPVFGNSVRIKNWRLRITFAKPA